MRCKYTPFISIYAKVQRGFFVLFVPYKNDKHVKLLINNNLTCLRMKWANLPYCGVALVKGNY